jgi:hypothetical protein
MEETREERRTQAGMALKKGAAKTMKWMGRQ